MQKHRKCGNPLTLMHLANKNTDFYLCNYITFNKQFMGQQATINGLVVCIHPKASPHGCERSNEIIVCA